MFQLVSTKYIVQQTQVVENIAVIVLLWYASMASRSRIGKGGLFLLLVTVMVMAVAWVFVARWWEKKYLY